ncbi:creatininase family protein [bacterium]|nr:creatininase family protein [bacterium]
MTWKTVKDLSVEVAILPWGATEAHNYHLPFGTDTIQADHIAAVAAEKAVGGGASVIVLPAIPYGLHTQQRDLALTMNLTTTSQAIILNDLIQSLEDAGVNKLLILNGHGGNDFKQMIRELQAETSVFLCTTNWWTVVDQENYFERSGDHAGELETSVMMHIVPDLVRPLSEAGSGKDRKFKIAALKERSVWAPRQWTQVTEDTGVGDPSRSTAEKGAAFVADVTEKLAAFLIDLSAADLSDMYES